MGKEKDAEENYIYLKRKDWQAVRTSLVPFKEGDIAKAYQENANRLRTNLSMGIHSKNNSSFKIDDDFVKNVVTLLNFKSSLKNSLLKRLPVNFDKNFFQTISFFIQEGLGSTSMARGKTTLYKLSSGNKNLKKMMRQDFVYQDFVDMIGTFNQIHEQISNFDAGFQQLAQLKSNTVGYIGNKQLEKTVSAMASLESFLNKYYGKGKITKKNYKILIDQMISDIISLSNNLISNLRGQLLEYLEYLKIRMQIEAADYVKATVKEINSGGNKITGQVFFNDGGMTGNKKVTQYSTQKEYVSKSDNITTLRFSIAPEGNIDVLFDLDIGISDKAYTKGHAGNKRIANSLSWESVFSHTVPQSLMHSSFQYYYANLAIFDPQKIRTPKGSLENKYLAAKASAFLIAGVEKGDIPQAYFIRYGDGELQYVPDLLEKIADDNKGNFGIASFFTFSNESKIEKKYQVTDLSKFYGGQQFEQQEGPTEEDRWNAAHKRTAISLSILREKLKFDAYR